jgi:hypothetical protein
VESVVAAVTSAVRCPSCVARLANWVSSAFCAVRKLALGAVVVVVELAYAMDGMPIPIAATSANTAMDRVVRFFMSSPFKGTVPNVENAIVRVM